MSLNIKNAETHQLVQELAALTGETQTAAVTVAVRERLERVRHLREAGLADRLLAIGADTAPRLREPFRSADHGDLLYDEQGLPRVIIDTSALVAILRAEPDASEMAHAIESAQDRRISAASWLETAVVIDASRDPVASRRFDELVQTAELHVEPVTRDQARIARDAYRDFGKGSGHKAGLNFGDCFAYALAKTSGEALLFKGNDFGHTDITPALAAAPHTSPG